MSEPARLEGRTQLVRIHPRRGRDPDANNASPSRMRERRSGRLDGCERSRMGDAFRPPSPAPFVVVAEAATVRERERVLVRENIEKMWGVGPAESSFTPCTSIAFASYGEDSSGLACRRSLVLSEELSGWVAPHSRLQSSFCPCDFRGPRSVQEGPELVAMHETNCEQQQTHEIDDVVGSRFPR